MSFRKINIGLWKRYGVPIPETHGGTGAVKYFNQIIKNYVDGEVKAGIEWIKTDDNNYVANGTATTGSSTKAVARNVKLTENHKYLICGCPANGTAATYFIALEGSAAIEYGNGAIYTASTSMTSVYCIVINGFTANDLVFKPRIIDLTDIFGYGKEPTTATDPRLDAVKAYAAKHGKYKPSSWLIDGVQWTYGAKRQLNGTIANLDSLGCALSDFIDVSTYKTIYSEANGNNTIRYCFFDKDKGFISTTSVYTTNTIDIPIDAEYCDITVFCEDYNSKAITLRNIAAITNIFNYADIPYYNQIYNYASLNRTTDGVTCKYLNNGGYSVVGTATSNIWFTLSITQPVIEGHTYLVTGCPIKGTSQSAFDTCLYFSGTSGFNNFDFGYGMIGRSAVTGNATFNIKINSGFTLDCVFTPRVVDLTDIYGYGNEPTTVNDDRIKELRRYAKGHWEYNKGSWVYDGIHWGNGIWRDSTTGNITALIGAAATPMLSTEGAWRIARRINKNVLYSTAIVFYDADKAVLSKQQSSVETVEWTVPADAAYYRLFICRVDYGTHPINPDYLDEITFTALTEDFQYYNQLYNPAWEQDLPTTSNGCTWTRNEDGTLHIEGTLTGTFYTSWYPIRASLGYPEKAKQIIDHHSYIVPSEYNIQQATADNIISNRYRFMKNVIKTNPRTVSIYGSLAGTAGQQINTNISRPFLVDLTNLFGYGQEPISYADARIKMLVKYLKIRDYDYVANPGACPDMVGLTRKAWIKHSVGQSVQITTTASNYCCRNLLYDISEYAGGTMTNSATGSFAYYYAFADRDGKFINNGYGQLGEGASVAIPSNACYVMHSVTSLSFAQYITDDVLTFTKA